MKKNILTVIFVATVGFLVFFAPKIAQNTPKTIKIGQNNLNLVAVADDGAEREQGLSGRESLKADEAMLFVFDKEGYYSFWMKDMKFPIDIAWLDRGKKIVHIEHSVGPETYPKSFVSLVEARFVLETQAGFFESHGIKIGDSAEF